MLSLSAEEIRGKRASLQGMASRGTGASGTRSDLMSALYDCRRALIGVIVFSGVMNILTLTGPLFMLQVYDRVIPSRSIATLVGLSAIAILMYAGLGFFDQLRQRILMRVGAYVDEVLHPKIFKAVITLPLRGGMPGDGLQPMRDLDQVRTFISSGGPAAFCDLPFLPIQVVICFLIHPLIGYLTLFGAVVIFLLTLATDFSVRSETKRTSEKSSQRIATMEATRRNAEVVRALGMSGRLADRWATINRAYSASNLHVMERAGGFAGISRIFRMMFQSGVLAVGAFLVIDQKASFGVIIAASILSARALQPVEQVVANWRGFIAARQSWDRLTRLFAQFPATPPPMALPEPQATLSVENLAVVPPGSARPAVIDAVFR